MLVLSRKPGESIVLPQLNILLTVVAVRGDRIRLGITAPPNVVVHREEVWQRTRELLESTGREAEPAAPAEGK